MPDWGLPRSDGSYAQQGLPRSYNTERTDPAPGGTRQTERMTMPLIADTTGKTSKRFLELARQFEDLFHEIRDAQRNVGYEMDQMLGARRAEQVRSYLNDMQQRLAVTQENARLVADLFDHPLDTPIKGR